MNKLLGGAIAIILLVIAVEGGYFWGLNTKTHSLALTFERLLTPTPYLSPYPAQQIPDALSYKAAVTISQLVPKTGMWLSGWSVGATGILTKMTKESITLQFAEEEKTFTFPTNEPVTYSQWSASRNETIPIDTEAINLGDSIGVSFTIETTNGTMKNVGITQNVE